MPVLIRPMLATPAPLPSAAEDRQWAYEVKWDGVRAVAYLQDGQLRLMSRTDRDITRRYPELAALPTSLRDEAVVLDGELVSLDAEGRPSFGRLQHRMHAVDHGRDPPPGRPLPGHLHDLRSPSHRRRVPARPALPGAPGATQRAEPDRAGVADPAVLDRRWRRHPGRDRGARPGRHHRQAHDFHLPAGPAVAGWRKIKNIRTDDVLIGGWSPASGRRAGTIGCPAGRSPHTGRSAAYIGKVGTGFTDAVLRDLLSRLTARESPTSPFNAVPVPREFARVARWVRPELVGEVAYAEIGPEGRLRQPSWRGYRPDKNPADVRRGASRRNRAAELATPPP